MDAEQLMAFLERLGYYVLRGPPVDHSISASGSKSATLPGGGVLLIDTMANWTTPSRWKRVMCRYTGRYVHIYTDDTVDEIVAKIEGQEKLL